MKRQKTKGNNNVQVGNDLNITINQILGQIHKIADIDTAIEELGSIQNQVQNENRKLDEKRIILGILIFFTLIVFYAGTVTKFSPAINIAALVMGIMMFFIGRLSKKMAPLKYQMNACHTIMSDLWKQKILFQVAGLQPATVDRRECNEGNLKSAG